MTEREKEAYERENMSPEKSKCRFLSLLAVFKSHPDGQHS